MEKICQPHLTLTRQSFKGKSRIALSFALASLGIFALGQQQVAAEETDIPTEEIATETGELASLANEVPESSVNEELQIEENASPAESSSKVANAVDKLNDSSKVANAVDKATDTGKAVVKSADSAGDVSRGTKGSGRASNKIKPDPNATGDHTVFKQNKETGAITNYRTYETNPHNPTGFQEVKGFDGIGRSHTNSLTSLKVETPHITSKTIPGGVRAASTWEIPTSLQNIIP